MIPRQCKTDFETIRVIIVYIIGAQNNSKGNQIQPLLAQKGTMGVISYCRYFSLSKCRSTLESVNSDKKD